MSLLDRFTYHFSWWRFHLSYKTRMFWGWFTRDLCWHLNKGGIFKRCVRCWLKNEMKKELNKEIDKQILYGNGS